MWNSLFHPSVSLTELLIRVTLVFFFILFLLRISGKRQLGQLSAIEFVSILLISNAVQNAMNAGDNSLIGGLVLAAGLVILSILISIFSFRYKKFRHLIEGTPTILVRHGALVEKHLETERVTREELMVMLRRQGIHHLIEIELAILESDGTLSVTLKEKAKALT